MFTINPKKTEFGGRHNFVLQNLQKALNQKVEFTKNDSIVRHFGIEGASVGASALPFNVPLLSVFAVSM
jgi:hypothetical protein